MSGDRKFRIALRLAGAEGVIIIGLLMYILELNSVIPSRFTWALAAFFGGVCVVIVGTLEKKYRKTPQ
jgi:uncharacterized membrane protein